MRIAHIINVTEINDSKKASYLHIAQPLTISSMVIARKMAKNIVDVELLAVKHKSEKVSIPPEFRWTVDIDKYAWEYIESLRNTRPHLPLPRLKDILLNLYNSSDAKYFIYTNLDIGLYPHFYLKVGDMISKGYDAIFINRMNLPKKYGGVLLDKDEIELIFSLDGIQHGGIDCTVFKREIIPSLNFGNVYIGYPPVGQVMKTQIELNSKNSIWIKDEKLTFHIGSDVAWNNFDHPYFKENKNQANGLYVSQFKKSKNNIYTRLRNKLKSYLNKLFDSN